MVLMEFKKFMFLVAKEIKQSSHQVGPVDPTKTKAVISPFPAPPLIGKAWDLLILYTKHYEEFSRFLLGAPEAWIDKAEPNYA